MCRKIIIGLDGVPHRLIQNLSQKGLMPATKKIIEEGTFTQMQSSLPEISSVAWSSIITGQNPGEHGVFGFTELIPGSYTLSFPNFKSLKTKTFWQQNPDKKYVLINIPFTYPVGKINGFIVAGFVALDLERATYPQEYLPKLQEISYEIDADTNKAHKSISLFLDHSFQVLEKRVKLYRYFWDKIDWDVFMFVFTGTDRLGHFLWDAYEDEQHEHHESFLKFFKRIDEIIGEIDSRKGHEDLVVLLSDHGFRLSNTAVNINNLLQETGFLSLTNQSLKEKNYNAITKNSQAFALDPARIYLNMKGKYPRGSVTEQEKEKVLTDLIDFFENLQYKQEKVVKNIFRKEEIYQGRFLELAPELLFLPTDNFTLKGSISKRYSFEKDTFPGRHSQEDAFFIINRKVRVPEDFSVADVLNLIKL